ncbi:autotransporter-associated beta strand repeat-containing protein [soil metagenome]
MKTLRRYRTSLGAFMTALVAIWQTLSPMNLSAATYYWDADTIAAGNNATTGVGLGNLIGPFTWNTSFNNWWDGVAVTDQPWVNGVDTAVFTGTAGTVTLGVPITAGGLTFNSNGYVLTGNSLTLATASASAAPVIQVTNLGQQASVGSILAGSSGLIKSGLGSLVLSNASNTYGGDTIINQGALVITNQGALGTSNSTVFVNGTSAFASAAGQLVLQGGSGVTGMTFNRALSLSGRGSYTTSAALMSIGNNTLNGNIETSALTETRIAAVAGTTTFNGLFALGAGAVQQLIYGNGNVVINGQIIGGSNPDTHLYKTTSGIVTTLSLTNSANNFVGNTRIDSGTIRVSNAGQLGLGTNAFQVRFNNGTLEVRADAADVNFTAVRLGATDNNANVFVDRAIGGSSINQTVAFGDFRSEKRTMTVTGRNGYGISFTGASGTIGGVGAVDGNVSFTNSGNGLMSVLANVMIGDGTAGRNSTFTISGDTLFTGSVLTAGSGGSNTFTKSNSGMLTMTGTASTYTGITNLNAGTIVINGFGAFNTAASTGRINFAGGTVDYRGAAGTGAGETVSTKTLLMNSTNSILLANQSGSSPSALVIATNLGANTTAAKALVLGGSNTLNNEIQGVITNNTVGTNVTKIGAGTWQVSDPVAANYGTTQAALVVTNVLGSQDFTGVSTTGLVVGQPVSGVGVPVGSVITEIMTATSFKINAVTTGAVTTVNLAQVSGATASLSVTGNAANVLTVGSTAGLVAGQSISGTGMVSGGWYISQINSATTFTVANSTGTAALADSAAIGTQTPTASVNYGGNLTIAGGTFKVAPTAAGSNVINDGSGVVFNVDAITGNGWAGGTFEYVGFSTGSSETVGALTPTAGVGTVKVTPGVSGTTQLTFGSLAARTAGATLNFTPGTGVISYTALPTLTNGIINGATLYNGTDWATLSGSNVAAYAGYTVTAGTITSGATQNIKIDNTSAGNINMAAGGNTDIFTLMANDATARTVNVGAGNTLRIGTTLGGILVNSASGGLTIGVAGTAGTLTTQSATSELAIYNNALLTINSAIVNNTATSLTKSGTGMLVLAGTNTFTGGVVINQGTVQLSGTGTLGGANQRLTIRQDGVLDLNGVSPGTSIGALNGAGRITNSAATTAATLTVGNGIVVATNSVYSGVIENPNGGAGALTNVTVTGAPTGVLVVNQALSGLNTYTGATTISNTGVGSVILQATSLANGGTASSIGASTNAASNLVFNGGTLQYTGSTATIFQTTQTPSVSIDRLFTLAGNGTIQSSGQYGNNVLGAGAQNNATLIFNNSAGALAYSGVVGARTLILGGTSLGDNEMGIQLLETGGYTLAVTKADAGLWILSNTANNYTGATTISAGQLRTAAGALSSGSDLILNGGIYETAGTFTRALGTTAGGDLRFTGGAINGGFAASTAALTVNIGSGSSLIWNSTANYLSTGALLLNSTTALAEVNFTNNIDLNAGTRLVTVADNTSTGTDFAILSGVISGSGAASIFRKNGTGLLYLTGANTYGGNTFIEDGQVAASAIGNGGGSSNFGSAAGTLTLGSSTANGNTTYLMYYGSGENTTRTVNWNSTTGTTTLDASGSGALILNSFTITGTGAKTLNLRGFNSDANRIASNIGDSGGITTITKSDGGTWVLSGTNGFTGNLNINAGLIGAASAASLGAVGTGAIITSNGGLFASGGAALNISRALQIAGNATSVFTGDQSITFNGSVSLNDAGSTNVWAINNTITGGILTFNNLTNNEATNTDTRPLRIEGTGATVINAVYANHASATTGNASLTLQGATASASLTLSGLSPNTYTGGTTLTLGTLILNKVGALGTGTLTFNGGVLQTTVAGGLTGATNKLTNAITLNNTATIIGTESIEFGGAVTNSGGNRTIQNNLSGAASLTISGTVNLSNDGTNRILTIQGPGNTTISGGIVNGSTSTAGALVTSGTGILTLSGTNTYAGTTTVNNTTLKLDYGTNDTSKLSDTAALNLNGGTLELTGTSGSHVEIVGSTVLTAGTANNVIRSGSTSAVLQMNTITVGAGATINFSADNIATTDNTNNTITNGILGGWATVGGTNFATNSTNLADGLIVAYTGYTDVTRLSSGLKVIANTAANNVRIVEGTGTLGDITLGAATTNINSLAVDAGTAGPATINPGTTETLRLGVAGGVLVTATSGALIIGTTSNDGNLSAGGSTTNTAGTINFSNFSPTNDITVNSAIINNNTGAVSLTKQGVGKVVLNGTNTATGIITITEGTVQMGAAGSITAAGALTINANAGATAVLDVNGRNVTTGAITLGGVSTTSSARILNTAGGGTMTVNGNVTYNATNNPLGSTIAANLNLGNNVERTFAVNDSTTAATDLTVSGNISGTGTTGIVKDNTGTLALSGTNTYTGLTTVRNGTLALQGGAAIANSATVNVIGNNGVNATLRVDNDETIGALTGNGNVNILTGQTLTVNYTNVVTPTVFNGGFTGAGTFKKTGAGNIELGGTSTGVINTEFTAGTTTLRNPNALGATGSQATFAAGTTLAFNNNGFIGLRTTSGAWLATGTPTLATAGAMVVTSAERTYTTDAREFGDNTGWVYSATMQNTSLAGTGTWAFGEMFDDSAYLKLNGTQILNNGSYNTFSSGSGTVNAGDNSVEVRVNNGTGGVGPVNWTPTPPATTPIAVNWLASTNPFGVGYSSYATAGDIIQANYTGFGQSSGGYSGGSAATFKAYTDAHVAADINLGGSVTVDTTLMVDASDRVFLDGVIRNAPASTGALVKLGYDRDLVLTGLNTYTGTTTISEGNLQVGNGGIGQSGTGATSVAAFAYLSGTGKVQGATTIGKGIVRPGDMGGASTGTLTFSNGLSFAAADSNLTVAIEMQISGALSSDKINITAGTFALNNEDTIQVLANGFTPLANTNYSWDLFDWVGALSDNGFNPGTSGRTGNNGAGNEGQLDLFDISSIIGSTWDTSQFLTTGVVSIVSVPEPSRMLLLMFGLMALFFRRKRRLEA